MILATELRKLSKDRLKDAEILFNNNRYDSAIYICGYAIEFALKGRICKTLKWKEFPNSNKEFENLKSLKTHNLDTLLHLCGKEEKVKLHFPSDWAIITTWDPEVRYNTNIVTEEEAKDMIHSIKNLIKII